MYTFYAPKLEINDRLLQVATGSTGLIQCIQHSFPEVRCNYLTEKAIKIFVNNNNRWKTKHSTSDLKQLFLILISSAFQLHTYLE